MMWNVKTIRVIPESSKVKKDLGGHIDKDLKFSKHVEVQVNKTTVYVYFAMLLINFAQGL